MYYYRYNTPIGELYIESDDEFLLSISVYKPRSSKLFESEIIKETHKQLAEYFNHERVTFDLPLQLGDSDFQKRVYTAMINVAYGTTASYKELAEAAKSPKAYRAVGSVCAKNPYPIVVPCHRILKSDKSLGGYAFGLEMKIKLLEIEGKNIKKGYVL